MSESSKHEVSGRLPWSPGWHHLLPDPMCARSQERCQAEMLTQVSGVQSFYWGSVTHCPHLWPVVYLLLLWKPELIWTACFEAPIINHIVRLASSQTPQADKDTPVRQDIWGASTLPPSSWGQRPDTLWVKIILHYTGEFYSSFSKKNSESSALNILFCLILNFWVWPILPLLESALGHMLPWRARRMSRPTTNHGSKKARGQN